MQRGSKRFNLSFKVIQQVGAGLWTPVALVHAGLAPNGERMLLGLTEVLEAVVKPRLEAKDLGICLCLSQLLPELPDRLSWSDWGQYCGSPEDESPGFIAGGKCKQRDRLAETVEEEMIFVL